MYYFKNKKRIGKKNYVAQQRVYLIKKEAIFLYLLPNKQMFSQFSLGECSLAIAFYSSGSSRAKRYFFLHVKLRECLHVAFNLHAHVALPFGEKTK